jgi:hypothetical protein
MPGRRPKAWCCHEQHVHRPRRARPALRQKCELEALGAVRGRAAWGTVREDYSEHGEAWEYFSHDHARSRAFRWSEDGLGAISDDLQRLCLGFAFWNGRDPILKERIFGLTGIQGNHGEDAKEYWHYVDSTPTHSWMRWRYLYHDPPSSNPLDKAINEGEAATEHRKQGV